MKQVGDFAKIDHIAYGADGLSRSDLGQDKTAAQIVEIMRVMESKPSGGNGDPSECRRRVRRFRAVLPQVTYFEMARICAIQPKEPLPVSPWSG